MVSLQAILSDVYVDQKTNKNESEEKVGGQDVVLEVMIQIPF